MGLFSKKGEPSEVDKVVDGQNLQTAQAIPASQDALYKKHGKPMIVFLSIFVVFAVAGCLFAGYTVYTKYVTQNSKEKNPAENNIPEAQVSKLDKAVELEKAKKLLESNPNDQEALVSAAENSRETNPEESREYFTRLLENYKKTNGLEDDNVAKTALVYWGGAGIAEKAGKTDEAVKYYKLVIQTANPANSYEVYIGEQSKAAIERLGQ